MPIQPVIPFDAIPLLASLKRDDRTAVEPLCRVRAYEKGEVLFREGDIADRIHFLYAGRAKIVKAVGGRDIILEILGPGEPVGAVAAFEQRPYPATGIAIEPSGVVSIPGTCTSLTVRLTGTAATDDFYLDDVIVWPES